MTSRLTILGCGHSGGTPLIGNYWGACDPKEPKNRRTRPSVMLQHDDMTLIIDTGADFRDQVNKSNISKIDAVLYTHYHADHTFGLDDLRLWCRFRNIKMPVYALDETANYMRQRFDYALTNEMDQSYPIVINMFDLKPSDIYNPIRIGGVPITVFLQDHKTCISLGVRFGNVAYSTDMVRLEARSIAALQGIDTWIVDAAAYNGTPFVHADLKTVYALNEKIGARQVYLTHMPPTMDYKTLCKELPKGYAPAYDGLVIDVKL
jgi:phosphoribosyl 1,2-cyclic phosphate phosphodiesterase